MTSDNMADLPIEIDDESLSDEELQEVELLDWYGIDPNSVISINCNLLETAMRDDWIVEEDIKLLFTEEEE